MMRIHSSARSVEGDFAEVLGEKIVAHDRSVIDSQQVDIRIFPNVQCYGKTPQDIDIVVVAIDRRKVPWKASDGRSIRSLCFTVELKPQQPRNIRFLGPQCEVRYSGRWHNASLQSEGQKYSLKGYIESALPTAPWVSNILWLGHCPKALFPLQATNLVGSDSSWQEIIDCIDGLVPQNWSEISPIRNMGEFLGIGNLLGKRIEPGNLDRRRLEAISRRVSSVDARYLEKLGEQLLIFRGRGGTGKTIRLLQLARELYEERGARVVVLTYNNALAADIRRLLSLLRIDDGIGEPGIGVRTVHKLFRDWLKALGLLDEDNEFLDRYDKLKSELTELISAGVLESADFVAARTANSRDLDWDFLFIDECQDWPQDERDLIYGIYGHRNVVLADGVDQLVRSQTAIDWRVGRARTESQIVSLRKSLRVKAGLCDAIAYIAEELGVSGWDLQPEHDIYGGRLVVFAGGQPTKDDWVELVGSLRESGNYPIDCLVCVTPDMVEPTEEGRRQSVVASELGAWGLKAWDGVAYDTRTIYPTSREEFRIVQYDSCRGLEGWIVVCYGLDRFFDWKVKQFEPATEGLFGNREDLAQAFASKWLMIPMTRAIDTLVIQVDDLGHPLSRLLGEVASRFEQVVEWRR